MKFGAVTNRAATPHAKTSTPAPQMQHAFDVCECRHVDASASRPQKKRMGSEAGQQPNSTSYPKPYQQEECMN